MFSVKEKQFIAEAVEKAILSLRHPEMPETKPMFKIHIEGKETWSWADIEPNWMHEGKKNENPSGWNEIARDVLSTEPRKEE